MSPLQESCDAGVTDSWHALCLLPDVETEVYNVSDWLVLLYMTRWPDALA